MSTATQQNNRIKDTVEETTADLAKFRQSLAGKAASFLGVKPDRLCGLLRNVWTTSKGQEPLTDQEMFSGISMIARYELDPIACEVYVTRDNKGRLMTIIGIDGWVKILDRTEHYDGFEMDLEFEEDGTPHSCTVTIHSNKRKHATVYTGYWKEYAKLTGFMGDKIPSHMLRLFTLHHAARLFTPLGAYVVTPEEAAAMMDAAPESATLDDLDAALAATDEPQAAAGAGGEVDASTSPSTQESGESRGGGQYTAVDFPSLEASLEAATDLADVNFMCEDMAEHASPADQAVIADLRKKHTKRLSGKGKQQGLLDGDGNDTGDSHG